MNYWLFIINDDIEVFKKRIDSKTWPIFNQTGHKRELEVGDCIMFYKAGNDGQKFLGRAKIASRLKSSQDKMVSNLSIDDVNVWSECPSIREFLTKLSFIKDEHNWGAYLQGGVKRLTENDYSIITQEAERTNS